MARLLILTTIVAVLSGTAVVAAEITSLTIEATADGVDVSTPQFQATATRASFSSEKRLLQLDGSADLPVTLVIKSSRAEAQRFTISLNNGRISAKGITRIKKQ